MHSRFLLTIMNMNECDAWKSLPHHKRGINNQQTFFVWLGLFCLLFYWSISLWWQMTMSYMFFVQQHTIAWRHLVLTLMSFYMECIFAGFHNAFFHNAFSHFSAVKEMAKQLTFCDIRALWSTFCIVLILYILFGLLWKFNCGFLIM